MTKQPYAENSFVSPQFAPFYQLPPKRFQNCRVMSVLFRTTPETLQALVPAPLAPNPSSLMFIYIGYMNVVTPLPYDYLEAGIGVPVLFRDTPGNYYVCLYLDKASAISAGREIYGFPKKEAEITFTEEKEGFTARVVQQGVTLIDASFQRTELVDPIPKEKPTPTFNLKLIPSVKKGAPPDVMQITSLLFEDPETKELQKGTATLKLSSSSTDPLGDISVVEILDSDYSVGDFTLGFGDVIYDYLHEGN
jgi:acetoacetate decarboxylase